MKVSEAAKILGVSPPTVHAMVRDGLLEADKAPCSSGRFGWRYELLITDVYLVAEVLHDLERKRELRPSGTGSGAHPTRRIEILRYYRQGYSIDWIAQHLKIKRRSVFRALNRAGIKFNYTGEVVCDRAAS